jgi:hypothetical protein
MAELETTLGDEVPRNAVLPFLLSAPVAIACAGAVLLTQGKAPLLNNWSTLTMALTHIGTLGFLTMLMLPVRARRHRALLGARRDCGHAGLRGDRHALSRSHRLLLARDLGTSRYASRSLRNTASLGCWRVLCCGHDRDLGRPRSRRHEVSRPTRVVATASSLDCVARLDRWHGDRVLRRHLARTARTWPRHKVDR